MVSECDVNMKALSNIPYRSACERSAHKKQFLIIMFNLINAFLWLDLY